MKITGAQIRAARAFLGISSDVLAESAELGLATIRRAEAVNGVPPITAANLSAIQRVLEARGIEFTNGDGQGVRMAGSVTAKPAKAKKAKRP